MKKKKTQSNEIFQADDILRSFCESEIDLCTKVDMDTFQVAIGIEMGIAYINDQIQKLKLEKKFSSDESQNIYENFAVISKKIAAMARNMINLKSEHRMQEIGLQIVQHNALSPLFAMKVTSMMIEEKSSFIH
jgi:hypothetical protein